MKTYAIGDIHGHFDQLIKLYGQLLESGMNPEEDKLVFLGDYVDGGPQTKQVVGQLIEWSKQYPHWVFLYGNHEDLLLDAVNPKHPVYQDYYLWWSQGGRETAESYIPEGLEGLDASLAKGAAVIPEEHIEWLKSLATFHDTEEYFFVHGGIWPDSSIKENMEKTSRYDMIWMREPFLKSTKDWGKKIIFGHTAMEIPLVMPNKIGIDCMFHNRGKLVALQLPMERFFIEEAE